MMQSNEVFVAYKNPNQDYHADFPDVTVAANGDVLMLVRKCGQWAHDATFKFGRPLTFFEAKAEIVVLRSTDGGRTFVEERTLYTGLAYDPMICTLSDGRMMAGMVVGEAGSRHERAHMRGVFHRHLPQLNTVITVRGVGVWFSDDHGHTWSSGEEMASIPEWENVYNLRKPFQVADGTILTPVAVGYPWRSRFVGVLRSFDDGCTWSDASIVAEDPAGRAHYAAGVGYWQPAMAVDPRGDMVCVCVLDDRDTAPQRQPGASAGIGAFRPTGVLPRLYRTHSLDSGFTWSQPQDTGLRGDFPSLVVLLDGRFLLTHTVRRPGDSSVLAHTSDDGGITWAQAAVVRGSANELFYYPNTAVFKDGALLTSFMTTPKSQVRFVQIVRWRLG